MENVVCPECTGNTIEEIEREITEYGLERTFECLSCDHNWSVTF